LFDSLCMHFPKVLEAPDESLLGARPSLVVCLICKYVQVALCRIVYVLLPLLDQEPPAAAKQLPSTLV